MDLQSVIEGCIAGNAKSQRMLFEFFAPKMLAVCIRYTSNKMEAEDVLQEGFIKLFQRIDSFEFKGSFEGWLRRLFVNTALDYLRKENKYKFSVEVDDALLDNSTSNFIMEGLEAADLLKVLDSLPSTYKTVFNLFVIEGYSHKEISVLLNISENTSKSNFFRARSIIQKKLEKINVTRY